VKTLRISINLPASAYQRILQHLFPNKVRYESVSFIFAAVKESRLSIDFNFVDWYAVKSNEYDSRSLWYVELKDNMRPKIIKKAFDLDAAIVEVHSHPHNANAEFSGSDLAGLQEFVPHVLWRLKGKPYAALVFSISEFDGLVWTKNPWHPQQLTELVVNDRSLRANGLTLNRKGGKHKLGSF
jgi:hypothetical protein